MSNQNTKRIHRNTDSIMHYKLFGMLWNSLPRFRTTICDLSENTGRNIIKMVYASEDGIVMGGAVGGRLRDDTTYLNFLFVPPQYRMGFGRVGANLLGAFEKECLTKYIEAESYENRTIDWMGKMGYFFENGVDVQRELKNDRMVLLTKDVFE